MKHEVMSRKELAALLDVHPITVWRWVDKKKIPHERTPGGRILFRRDTVLKLFR